MTIGRSGGWSVTEGAGQVLVVLPWTRTGASDGRWCTAPEAQITNTKTGFEALHKVKSSEFTSAGSTWVRGAEGRGVCGEMGKVPDPLDSALVLVPRGNCRGVVLSPAPQPKFSPLQSIT